MTQHLDENLLYYDLIYVLQVSVLTKIYIQYKKLNYDLVNKINAPYRHECLTLPPCCPDQSGFR